MALMQEADRRGLLPPDKKAILAEAVRSGLVSDEQDFSKPEAPTVLEKVGRGMADVTEGVKQGGLMVKDIFTGGSEADTYTAEKTGDIGLYERGRQRGATTVSDLISGKPADPGIDWWRLGGNVAATLPVMAIPGAGAAGMGTRIASGAVQGAVASGSMFTPEGESKTAQTTLGGLLGGVVPVVGRALRPIGGKIADLFRTAAPTAAPQQALVGELTAKLQQQGMDWKALTTEIQESLLADAQKALQAGGTLDDAMLANKATIEAVGAKPTQASISRQPKDWQTEMNLRGGPGGESIMQRHKENALAMTDYLQKLRSGTGGRTTTAAEAGESSIKALQEADAAKEKVVSNLYDAYRASGGEYTRVPQTKLTNALGEVIDSVGLDSVPPAVVNRLKDFGFLDSKVTRNLTIKEADTFNKLLNAQNPGFGPASKAIGMLKSALNDSLLDVPTTGLKSSESLLTARKAAAERFAEQRAGKGITAAIDDVSPDRFVKKFVLDADVRDVRAMKAELLKTAAGSEAMRDVKGHLLDTALLKATNSTSLDDLAFKIANKETRFSGAVFGKWLDSIAPEKLHVLLTPDEVGALRTLQKASKLLTSEVPFSDVNHSKTAAALAELMKKIGNTPFLGSVLSMSRLAFKAGKTVYDEASARKQIAEILVGSAGKSSTLSPLPAPGRFARVAPAMAGGAAGGLNQERERDND